ncbi:X-linked interleukin-1 receptor accessory protein-like 2 isoform 2-T2 [Pholidichthys leucotaenia]
MIVPLLVLFVLLTGMPSMTPKEIKILAGDMVALPCQGCEELWRIGTKHERHVYNNMSAAEQRRMGVVVLKQNLVILNASVNHEGNYSCSSLNGSSQCFFNLRVYTPQSEEYEEEIMLMHCFTRESCELHCQEKSLEKIFENTNTICHKEDNEAVSAQCYSSNIDMKDSGTYTCIQSYKYEGQLYKKTIRTRLKVHKTVDPPVTATIIKPHNNSVVEVELGSKKEIPCLASPCSAVLHWLSGNSFVDTVESSSIFYKEECNNDSLVATLIFKAVSEKDLSTQYTCKIESEGQSGYVTVSLKKIARPSYASLVISLIIILAVMGVTVTVYAKFKIDIILFLRDTVGWFNSTSDGKNYDGFLMCYKSNTDRGLNDQDRKWLESVLEERFGYSLCIFDRDILPGKAVAEAVLDCIEQSRTVVLVPTSPDPHPECGLLSAIHEALVERQTHLVFVNTEVTEDSRSGLLPEALQFLSMTGDCITWKGKRSMALSSSFLKQLRYYLPPPQRTQKLQFLPQTSHVFP